MKWTWVHKYKGYYKVSTHGDIRSVPRTVETGRGYGLHRLPGVTLKPSLHRDGYLKVDLSKNGKVKTYSIHRLVALAFIPNPDNLPEVNHKDLDKTNNRAGNLEWTTSVGNTRHAILNGANPNSKLTWGCVFKIRRLYNTTCLSQRALAKKFRVAQPTIGKIVNHKIWVEV